MRPAVEPRKFLIAAIHAVVSVAVLGWVASQVGLADSVSAMAAIPLGTGVLAAAIVGVGFLASTLRWQILLKNFAVAVPLWRLAVYYLIGLFVSLFLPTSAGGDAYRIYMVGRLSSKPVAALFATLQERLIGLCGALAVSLAVMPVAGRALPADILPWIAAVQIAALVALPFVLSPPLFLAVWAPLARRVGALNAARWKSIRVIDRLSRMLAGFGALMRTMPSNVLVLLLLATIPALLVSISYQIILSSIGVAAQIWVLMLIIPIVWIVRFLPISLGGIGVGEGAFVLLAGFAGIDREKAFAAALAVLAIQILWALVGGALLLRSGLKTAFDYARRG
ncbi:MAG TPA: lysylphosphatidylglycerol synthase transmembrane domain-containing protein [Casimicrobiaceae bacterium]